MKRKYFQRLFVCIMVVLLAACNSEESNSSGSADGENGNKVEFSQGVTDKEILIGTTGPQTGPLAPQDAAKKGMAAYFNYVNENGGVHGRKIKFISFDDQYQPTKAVQFAKRLVDDDKVFLVAGNTGTATNKAAKDIYIEKGIPTLMAASGAKEFVDPPAKNWFGAAWLNYEIEAKILLNYAVNELGAMKIAIAYQNDDFGKAPLNEVKGAIKNYPDAEIVAEVPFLPTDTEFSSQAKKLHDANPDTIIGFGVTNPVVNLKKAMYKIGFKDVNFLVTSAAGNESRSFDLAGADVWEGTYSSDFHIEMNKTDNDKINLFLKELKKQYPNEKLNALHLNGWGTAQVVVETLKRTNGEFTWDKVFEVLNTFGDWDGSVFTNISFSEKNHYGITSLYMTKAQNGKIERISDTITFDPVSGEIPMQK